MKRRTAILAMSVAAGVMAASLSGEGVRAMTYASSDGFYQVKNWRYDDPGSEMVQTERQKDLENWQREQLREEAAPLEKYGVMFDEEQGCLLYQGKKIRLLIDQQIEDTYASIQMPEGEIDLYTVRSEDYRLTGVRAASQEEYDRHTKNLQESENEALYSSEFSMMAEDAAADGVSEYVDGCASQKADAIVSDIPAYTDSCASLEETASGFSNDIPTKEEQKRIAEYADAGIERNSHGGWLYHGKAIDWLVDENGGIYMTNVNKDREDKLYIVVKRKEDGSVQEVVEVTLEDAIRSHVENET